MRTSGRLREANSTIERLDTDFESNFFAGKID